MRGASNHSFRDRALLAQNRGNCSVRPLPRQALCQTHAELLFPVVILPSGELQPTARHTAGTSHDTRCSPSVAKRGRGGGMVKGRSAPPPRPPPKPWCPEALRPSTAGWTNGFGGLEMQPSLVSGREGCQKDSSFSLGWPGSGEPVLSLSRATLRGSSRCC